MNAAAWQGPPTGILGCPVPIHRLLARTDHAVIALRHVTAFPQGCSIELHLAVRRGSLDEAAWEGLLARHTGAGFPLGPTDDDDDLKLGVAFPDGSRATTVGNAFRGWAGPADRPAPPMLVEAGGESSSGEKSYESGRRLWLWPLPAAGPFELVAQWRSVGIDTTATTLDGAAIGRAAEQALPYWP
ncbi:MAG TPA: hypothetical protein VMG38_06150 [Trebonia sp.]|nr:hypothetical protein [Trebonia sp.]